MPYNYSCSLWPTKGENFFREKQINPIHQKGPHCVSTVLAMLSRETPEYFQSIINTQDPISWSDSLKEFGMKLAYCPTDVRKFRYYMDELIKLDDLFLLCYYSPIGNEILKDPDENGWVCGSHIVILHRDIIIDPKRGDETPASDHECNNHHTKRIFRVVPNNYERGL